jgi:hypothetical protein
MAEKSKECNHERFELQKILHKYITEELLKYQVSLTDDFYKEIFRLWGLQFTPKNIRSKPSFVGKLTVRYIYEQLPESFINKRTEKGTGKKNEWGNCRYEWRITSSKETWRESLAKQIHEVTALMSISESKEQFDDIFQKKYGTEPIQLQPEFSEELELLSEFNMNLKRALNYRED